MIIWMDNAGKNKALQECLTSNAWKFTGKFKYTAAHMPQKNSLVELSFAHISARARALLNAANVLQKY